MAAGGKAGYDARLVFVHLANEVACDADTGAARLGISRRKISN